MAKTEAAPALAPQDGPIEVKGKFFFAGEAKFFIKGVTYGPFAVASHGAPFPEKAVIERDFAAMRELGANCLRTFTVPPRWLLDLARLHDLRVMVGIPWAQHVCFLDSGSVSREIRSTAAAAARACAGHPAVLAYLVGNEIPPDIVRWHGASKIRDFLRRLADTVKEIDPKALVGYANFPSTEYLELEFMDFTAFNVYLHDPAKFRAYLSHLQNLAADRPLVLTEFGMDSIREGLEAQARTLSDQVGAAFEMGAAGAVVFSWTDEWYALQLSGGEGFEVDDWAFGLVDRKRRKKPAFHRVQRVYRAPLPPALPRYPRVSVVVCAYNAERTMESCLSSLEKLDYPDYEVIVVNDGSTDRTGEIAERHDSIRIIHQPNRGLSAARNAGIAAANGEIIAFTDSDCMADPGWLDYLVAAFQSSGLAAVGGPNLPPPDDCWVAACVAVSPGAPAHVLLDDAVAEHIPGCNMAFRREALKQVSGFDPLFRAAGDDVDLCWRLQNRGYTIGFSPAALVWHFRRNTVRDYVKQQRGYGKAEALLYFKHPNRFNILGQSRWFGRIYGDLGSYLLSRRPVIYSGTFGRGLFQTLYQAPSSLFAYLPLTLEWNVAAWALLACALLFGGEWWLGAAPLSISIATCAASAMKARIEPRYRTRRARMLVALLIYTGPLVRSLERYRWRLKRIREIKPVELNGPRQRPSVQWQRRLFALSYWTESALDKENLLYGLMNFLLLRKYLIAMDQGWNDWDLEIAQGRLAKARIKAVSENHAGSKKVIRLRCALSATRFGCAVFAALSLAAACGLALRLPNLAAAAGSLAALHGVAVLVQQFRLGRVLYHTVEIVGKRLRLVPLGKGRIRAVKRAEQESRAQARDGRPGPVVDERVRANV